jgi:hypothetical protein
MIWFFSSMVLVFSVVLGVYFFQINTIQHLVLFYLGVAVLVMMFLTSAISFAIGVYVGRRRERDENLLLPYRF